MIGITFASLRDQVEAAEPGVRPDTRTVCDGVGNGDGPHAALQRARGHT